MTCLWVGAVFALLYCASRWSRHKRKEPLAPVLAARHRPRRRQRMGDRRRRELGKVQARKLVAAFARDLQAPRSRPALGTAPQTGATVHGQATARLETWSRTTTWGHGQPCELVGTSGT